MKKIIAISLLTMFLAGIGFVTTSKREYDPNAPVQTDYCLEPGFDAKIKINLDPFNISSFRVPAYAGYIPTPDLRNGGSINSAGTSLLDDEKFFCTVTVIASGCNAWRWTRAVDATNTDNSGVMKIKMPPNEVGEAIVKVEYFERESGRNAPQFNIKNFSRLKYVAQQIYLGRWNASVAQPITLYPVDLQDSFRFILTDASFEKGSNFGDVGGVNEYIDLNGITP